MQLLIKIINLPVQFATMSKILLVDNSKDLCETLSTLLTIKGYRVEVAYEQDNLLESVRQRRPDLVLLHVGLEDADGREICQSINRQFGQNIPVILTSGDYKLLSYYQEFGAIDFLEKPFEFSLLLNKLDKVFLKQ